MNPLNKAIQKSLLSRKSILLIGPTDSGKTWYAEKELIPFIKGLGLEVGYFENPDEFINSGSDIASLDVCVFDEVETFIDKDFLTGKYGEGYYSPEYVRKATSWIRALSSVKIPSIFIVSRNSRDEINHLMKKAKTTDWGKDMVCLEFKGS